MNKLSVMIMALLLTTGSMKAQTVISSYKPGVTSEGAVYYLPKTAIRITFQIEKTTYTPGEFCKYSEKYLRIKDVSPTPSTKYRLMAVSQEPFAVADTSKCFAVKFDARTSACNVRLSDDGILLAINRDIKQQKTPQATAPIKATPITKSPKSYLSEEILSAGSTAKMAELTAQEIYEIRESRGMLAKGQADFMPKDGEQLRLMLQELDTQDQALTSLFTGVTTCDTTSHTITYIVDKPIKRDVLFRISPEFGLVDNDDLSGTPYYINIENLKTVAEPAPADPKKAVKPQQAGIYVNIPGRLRATIFDAKNQILASEFPAAQFGNVELLSGALFNKKYTTRLLLHPLTGAVENLEAEQPK
ncbi:DUF4831 family protein [Prevotella sp. P6B4]|uniref:DUF4831 family protein n=1 Tax=Prevotella sp. P6B4 TaxID=1410614 RepID=UPI000490F2DA|nr:DUF4831 family protein [Prevotella sp. P6B4]